MTTLILTIGGREVKRLPLPPGRTREDFEAEVMRNRDTRAVKAEWRTTND